MNFSINLDFIYEDRDYCAAIKEVKEIGFDNVEICFMQNKSLDKLLEVQKETGMKVNLMLSYFVDLTDGDKKDEFIKMIKVKLEEAKALGCKKIIIAVGDYLETISHEEQLKNIENGLIEMIPLFEEYEMIMLLEPINNKVDHQETGLWSSEETFAMLERLNHPSIKMLYDIYHMQVMEGDVTRTMLNHLDVIEHVHCASNPGRNEIYYGELNYVEIVRALSEAGYKGDVGIEFKPTEDPKVSLKKIKEMFAEFM